MATRFSEIPAPELEELVGHSLGTPATIADRRVLRDWEASRVERVVAVVERTTKQIIVKQVPPSDPEAGIYLALRSSGLSCIPLLHALVRRQDDQVLVIEYIEGPGLYAMATQDNYRRAVDQLVMVHSHFWERRDQLESFGLPLHTGPFLQQRSGLALSECRSRIEERVYSEIRQSHVDEVVPAYEAYVAALPFVSAQPITLVHGDYHFGNIILGHDGTPMIIDWGSAAGGIGLLDLVALLDVAARMGSPVPDPDDLIGRYFDGTRQRIGPWITRSNYQRLFGLCQATRSFEELNWFNSSGEDYGARALRELKIIHEAV